jgi:hypothetical protein
MAAARSITIVISMKNQEKRSKEGLVSRIRLVEEWSIDEKFDILYYTGDDQDTHEEGGRERKAKGWQEISWDDAIFQPWRVANPIAIKIQYYVTLSRYAECYPRLAEMDDAIGDSDDEADFSKMDLGNKKGPVGRFVMQWPGHTWL